jgi:uncharacterized protein (TIGR03643 family)
MENHLMCEYSGLPSPMAYVQVVSEKAEEKLDLDRIVEMAWEDRTPFDAIYRQFGLREEEVRKLMKKTLQFSSYKRWRKRVETCATKHEKKRNQEISRFKCSRQRTISNNKISKRNK